MKKILISLFFVSCTTLVHAQIKDWALGLKIGQPTGVNIRKYGDRNAFDVNIGTYGGLFGGTSDYRKGRLKGVGFAINANYLWYAPAFKERMSLYGGVGAQLTSRNYYPDITSDAHDRSIGIGPTVVAGVEFLSKRSPYSLFVEGGLYAELLPAFFYLSPQLNAGLRYNF